MNESTIQESIVSYKSAKCIIEWMERKVLYESKKKHKWIQQFIDDSPINEKLDELVRAGDYL